MKKEQLQIIEQEYNQLKPNLDRFREALLIQIEKLLEIKRIPLGFPIQNRTKEWSSIVEKIESGRYNINKSVMELQDLVGLRIILLFNRDVENVCKLIQENLEVLRQYDTAERLKDDQFGYSSFHIIISIPKVWQSVPTFLGLEEYIAEIQVRTLSQHTWAEASLELQYKQEENVPRPLLRSIGRVSALLETVDLEFERLLKERELYKKSLDTELSSTVNPQLNVDILEAILDKYLPEKNKDTYEPYASLLEDLKLFNINDKNKLEELINRQLKSSLEIDKHIVQEIIEAGKDKKKYVPYRTSKERIAKGVFYTHIGLIRAMIECEIPKEWNAYIREKRKPKKK